MRDPFIKSWFQLGVDRENYHRGVNRELKRKHRRRSRRCASKYIQDAVVFRDRKVA